MSAVRDVNGALVRKSVGRGVRYIGMTVLAVVFLFPMVWMLAASTKPDAQIFREMGKLAGFLPNVTNVGEILNNYLHLFTQYVIWKYMINSVFYCCVVVAGNIAVNTMAAFALARFRFPGKGLVMALIIGLIVIPVETTIIPLYTIAHSLGLTGTVLAVLVPPLVSAYNIFLFRQFFLSIPRELEEAAVMDGAGGLVIYFRIIMPLSKGILATIATFTFIGVWNDYVWPIMVLPAPSGEGWPLYPIQAALNTIQQQPGITTGEVMASLTLATIPLIVVYTLAQNYIIEGLGHTGLK